MTPKNAYNSPRCVYKHTQVRRALTECRGASVGQHLRKFASFSEHTKETSILARLLALSSHTPVYPLPVLKYFYFSSVASVETLRSTGARHCG